MLIQLLIKRHTSIQLFQVFLRPFDTRAFAVAYACYGNFIRKIYYNSTYIYSKYGHFVYSRVETRRSVHIV